MRQAALRRGGCAPTIRPATAVIFDTCRTLARERGLTNDQAVALMARLVEYA